MFEVFLGVRKSPTKPKIESIMNRIQVILLNALEIRALLSCANKEHSYCSPEAILKLKECDFLVKKTMELLSKEEVVAFNNKILA